MNNYHTHTTFCDGKDSPEETVLKAIELGMEEIGFSAHSYTPFDLSCCLKEGKEQEYKTEILRLKQKYESKIKIYLGIEQDYYSQASTEGYDYVIGSVHYVLKNGEYIYVDVFKDKQIDAVNRLYGGDYLAFVKDYYHLVQGVCEKTSCHIVGHFDLITKLNGEGDLFDENSEEYLSVAKNAAKTIAQKGAFIEVNTGAVARGYRKEFYPAKNLLKIFADSGKPFVLSSDAHNKENLLFGLADAEQELKKLGYSTVKSINEIIKGNK